jgi:tetratricopeptide (TPR) repeat protein
MSTYPGNSTLSSAVKERVLSTFQQALVLFKQGRTEEVAQGCGLILRMDPMFDPAKKLLEKSRNPAAPIDVDSLLVIQPSADPMADARAAFAQRDFQRALDITTELLTQDLMNDDARVLNEKARERIEAQPFIDQFTKKVESSIATGNYPAARTDLEKIRQLDPEHPAIGRLQQALGGGQSPSFVVDSPAAPPASGRGTAQAADFGFTFEEEKPKQAPAAAPSAFSFGADSGLSPFSTDTGTTAPITPPADFSFDAPAAPVAPPPPAPSGGGFSFDTPPPAASPFGGGGGFSFDAAAPAKQPGGEFDFATGSVATSPDDQAKVQQFLSDGDRAFEAGDDQQAIDLWSRIFLIDVTNEEASARIERAKARKREAESQVENVLASAIQLFDRDKAAARDRFLEVLRHDPNNATANDYLERINASLPSRTTTSAAAAEEAPADDVFADDASFEAPVPPAATIPKAAIPAAGAKKAAPKAAPAPAKRGVPMVAIIAVAVVVLLGGGWFVWSKMSKPSVDPAATAAVFTQASSLAQKGQYDLAIAMLQDIKPEDPQHDKALSMIADLQHRKTQTAELIGGRPAAVVFQENLANGKAAFEAHDYDAAKKAFDAAARIKALPPDMKSLYDTAAQQVSKLDAAKTLFKEQRYADALTNLQSLEAQDPQNASIKRMIIDAHFNLGAQALTEERLPDAIKEFDEVLKMDPADDLAKRSKALGERYNGQSKDLLYKIYVKYLPTRRVS